jgi:membrane protein DedA with SNARE-associated domain
MFETLLRNFADSPLSLWGPFIVLILCGLGLPVPEDIVLVAAGALAETDGRGWIETSAVMYAGVMLGDSTIFFAGRYFGGKLRSSRWFRRSFSEKKQARVEALFERYDSMVLFVGRFLPGLRAPIFFTAGSTRVKFWKFFLFDGLAALISVPFFVWLGHWLWEKFSDDVTQLERALARTHSYTLVVASVILLVVGVVVYRLIKNARTNWDD